MPAGAQIAPARVSPIAQLETSKNLAVLAGL